MASAAPRKQRSKRKRPYTHTHCIFFLFFITALLSVFIGSVLYLFVLLDIPAIDSLESYRPKLTTRILDSEQQVIARVYSENRLFVSGKDIPDLLAKAFVAAEDARFYQHPGVDFWSIFRALLHNIRVGGRGQGGSTITQQVTRSLLLSRKKLYSRKIKEAILAYRIDSLLSKDDIISIYLNQIYLGEGAHGVETAALVYFGKHARELDLAEMAILAGLPQAPSRYSPFKNMTLAKNRQAYVLNRMAEEGYITPTAARKAYNQPITLATKEDTSECGYFVQHVKNYLERKYGRQKAISGGLTVYTTLDRSLQKAGVAAITRGLKLTAARHQGNVRQPTPPQGSLLSLEVATGRVRAMVGGANFSDSQFNRAVQARRQPGSAFKPIVYAAALAKGLTPATRINDSPLQLPGPTPGDTWTPKNFDGKFHGPTTLRDGLINSRNIVTIKLLQKTGIKPTITLARQLGIHSPLAGDLSLALGSSEVSLLELTAAYAPFSNGGKAVRPLFIDKILDRDAKILEENKPLLTPAITNRIAFQMTLMLKGVIEEGTGRNARGLKVPTAGKTGTTDQNRDAWFIGYTPTLVTGVWVGHDQERSLGKGETGGRMAAPIWLDFMAKATKNDRQGTFFPMPD
jgi:penicillin-binding protein 1A